MSRRRSSALALALGLVPTALLVAGCGDEPPYQALSIASSDAFHRRATLDEAAAGALALDDLAAELYAPFGRASGNDGQGNFVFSPAALGATLGRLHLGAEGRSADQLAALLGPIDEVDLDTALAGALDPVRDANGATTTEDGSEASVAVGIHAELVGQSGLDVDDAYVEALKVVYDEDMPFVDFEDAPDHGVNELNRRVADQTIGEVEGLVSEDAVSSSTRLIATAAVGLRSPWLTALDNQGTAPFTRPDGSTVDVPMVGGKVGGGYVLAEDWQSVSVPLAGGRLGVTIILPDEGKLRAVQDDLAAVLAEAIAGTPQVGLTVSFPSFEVATEPDVEAALDGLGVSAPFAEGTEDFSKISDDEPLPLGGVFHRAALGVDATGATTGGSIDGPSAGEGGEVDAGGVLINRTFLFVVHQPSSGTPLLVGRISDPTA
jgi:serpin B